MWRPRPRRDPPWHIWEGIALLAVFFFTQLGVSLLAALLYSVFWESPIQTDDATRALFTLPPTLLVSYVIVWLAIYWLIVKRHRRPFLAAIRLGRVPLGRLFTPLIAGMTLQLATAVLVAFFPPAEDHQFSFDIFLHSGPLTLAFFFIVAVVLAPLLEEVLFRGVLYPALRFRFGFWLSAGVVTVLFTALHGFQTGAYWPALAGIGFCGFILAWLRERTQMLWASVAFHVGFNLMAFLPVFFLKL